MSVLPAIIISVASTAISGMVTYNLEKSRERREQKNNSETSSNTNTVIIALVLVAAIAVGSIIFVKTKK
jgi:uncharacterized membrane protein YidH (DUF202 family)